jgi:hypothetical protein
MQPLLHPDGHIDESSFKVDNLPAHDGYVVWAPEES